MKITNLHIEKYKHLENLEFDFTYQSGEKKGQPLEKICFIGQSATGKTNLLELISNCLKYALEVEIIENKYISFNSQNITKVNFTLDIKNEKLSYINNTINYRNQTFTNNSNGGLVTSLINFKDKKEVIYIKSNIISDHNINFYSLSPLEISDNLTNDEIKEKQKILNYYKTTSHMTFDNKVEVEVWLYLLSEILNYRKKFNQKMTELIYKGLLADTKKLQKEFEKWQSENPNELKLLADKLNPLLEKLHLEVDTINAEYSIPIKRKNNDEVIAFQNTSTGTKGLLLSFLPLYKLKERESIVIIDEPERSLYPDIQIDLMDNYRKIAPNSQFIIATHSPFIAAAFEPDERFILYFDEEGNVKVRRGSSPIGDDPNDILNNDFNINYINKYGQKKYEEYIELKQQIYFEKDEIKKAKISEKLEKLGEEYNF
nr:ATP-binding protein [uncultured Flavobacterium sp.]